MKKQEKTTLFRNKPKGFALLVTLIILVVLASLTAGLATRLTMAKRRQQYMIEYQRARYGLDSGVKYIISEMPRLNFPVQPRKDVPDFSDLFWMDQQEYAQMITTWAANVTDEQIDSLMKKDAVVKESAPLDTAGLLSKLSSLFGGGDSVEPNQVEPNQINIPENEQAYVVEIDPNDIQVPGPYGPPWPYAIEPIKLEIGPCQVTVTIEDENAKLPLSWLVTTPKIDDNEAVKYALETFGEWMQMTKTQMEDLQAQCEEIAKQKRFQLNAGPILVRKRPTVASRQSASTRRTATRRPATQPVVTQKRPAVANRTDFAKLFHSSLLNREELDQPLPDTGQREVTPLKYLGLWGSQRVNINTAPRQVLQAAFMLALTWDDAVNLTDQVIVQRQQQPFKSVNSLKEIGSLDTDTFNKLKNYITTTSTFFKVTVTSNTGSARAKVVLAIVKEGSQTDTLMMLYDES